MNRHPNMISNPAASLMGFTPDDFTSACGLDGTSTVSLGKRQYGIRAYSEEMSRLYHNTYNSTEPAHGKLLGTVAAIAWCAASGIPLTLPRCAVRIQDDKDFIGQTTYHTDAQNPVRKSTAGYELRLKADGVYLACIAPDGQGDLKVTPLPALHVPLDHPLRRCPFLLGDHPDDPQNATELMEYRADTQMIRSMDSVCLLVRALLEGSGLTQYRLFAGILKALGNQLSAGAWGALRCEEYEPLETDTVQYLTDAAAPIKDPLKDHGLPTLSEAPDMKPHLSRAAALICRFGDAAIPTAEPLFASRLCYTDLLKPLRNTARFQYGEKALLALAPLNGGALEGFETAVDYQFYSDPFLCQAVVTLTKNGQKQTFARRYTAKELCSIAFPVFETDLDCGTGINASRYSYILMDSVADNDLDAPIELYPVTTFYKKHIDPNTATVVAPASDVLDCGEGVMLHCYPTAITPNNQQGSQFVHYQEDILKLERPNQIQYITAKAADGTALCTLFAPTPAAARMVNGMTKTLVPIDGGASGVVVGVQRPNQNPTLLKLDCPPISLTPTYTRDDEIMAKLYRRNPPQSTMIPTIQQSYVPNDSNFPSIPSKLLNSRTIVENHFLQEHLVNADLKTSQSPLLEKHIFSAPKTVLASLTATAQDKELHNAALVHLFADTLLAAIRTLERSGTPFSQLQLRISYPGTQTFDISKRALDMAIELVNQQLGTRLDGNGIPVVQRLVENVNLFFITEGAASAGYFTNPRNNNGTVPGSDFVAVDVGASTTDLSIHRVLSGGSIDISFSLPLAGNELTILPLMLTFAGQPQLLSQLFNIRFNGGSPQNAELLQGAANAIRQLAGNGQNARSVFNNTSLQAYFELLMPLLDKSALSNHNYLKLFQLLTRFRTSVLFHILEELLLQAKPLLEGLTELPVVIHGRGARALENCGADMLGALTARLSQRLGISASLIPHPTNQKEELVYGMCNVPADGNGQPIPNAAPTGTANKLRGSMPPGFLGTAKDDELLKWYADRCGQQELYQQWAACGNQGMKTALKKQLSDQIYRSYIGSCINDFTYDRYQALLNQCLLPEALTPTTDPAMQDCFLFQNQTEPVWIGTILSGNQNSFNNALAALKQMNTVGTASFILSVPGAEEALMFHFICDSIVKDTMVRLINGTLGNGNTAGGAAG